MQRCRAKMSTRASRSIVHNVRHHSGEPGDGAGQGGGTGGTIRDAGGAFGKREYALEESYFYKKEGREEVLLREDLREVVKPWNAATIIPFNLQREQLQKLKEQWDKIRGKSPCEEKTTAPKKTATKNRK